MEKRDNEILMQSPGSRYLTMLGKLMLICYSSMSCQRTHWKRHKNTCIIPIVKQMIEHVPYIFKMLPKRLPQDLTRLMKARSTLEVVQRWAAT